MRRKRVSKRLHSEMALGRAAWAARADTDCTRGSAGHQCEASQCSCALGQIQHHHIVSSPHSVSDAAATCVRRNLRNTTPSCPCDFSFCGLSRLWSHPAKPVATFFATPFPIPSTTCGFAGANSARAWCTLRAAVLPCRSQPSSFHATHRRNRGKMKKSKNCLHKPSQLYYFQPCYPPGNP